MGIEVEESSDGIFIGQKRYVAEVVATFNMENRNVVKNPIVPSPKLLKDTGEEKNDETIFKKMVGSLMYLTATMPDLMYGVCLIS